MEEQIDILKTRRMSWDAVSRILEESVHELLGKKIRIRAWAEDTDYWGAMLMTRAHYNAWLTAEYTKRIACTTPSTSNISLKY